MYHSILAFALPGGNSIELKEDRLTTPHAANSMPTHHWLPSPMRHHWLHSPWPIMLSFDLFLLLVWISVVCQWFKMSWRSWDTSVKIRYHVCNWIQNENISSARCDAYKRTVNGIMRKPCYKAPIWRWWWRKFYSWWRHQMETFSALLDFCAGNSTVTGEFPSQRPVTQSFDVFFDLCLNKQLSKQS